MGFWDGFWLVFWFAMFLAYLIVLSLVARDLLGDPARTGLSKALWVTALLVFPFLGTLVYMLAEGNRGLGHGTPAPIADGPGGAAPAAAGAQAREASGTGGTAGITPAEQIVLARSLVEAGAITEAEFQRLKAKALA